jgi:hypothetical protein
MKMIFGFDPAIARLAGEPNAELAAGARVDAAMPAPIFMKSRRFAIVIYALPTDRYKGEPEM